MSPAIITFQLSYVFRPSVRAVNSISHGGVIATGAAYSRAETGLREFVEMSGMPFLPTPMGKGVLPDDHPNCVAAARSRLAPLTVLWLLKVMHYRCKRKHLFFFFTRCCLTSSSAVSAGKSSATRWCYTSSWCKTQLDPALWSATKIWPQCKNYPGIKIKILKNHCCLYRNKILPFDI